LLNPKARLLRNRCQIAPKGRQPRDRRGDGVGTTGAGVWTNVAIPCELRSIMWRMASVPHIAIPAAILRIQRVQNLTVAWMSVETAVSLFAAWVCE